MNTPPYLIAVLFLLIGSSCVKKGCTDPCAYNFEPTAHKDNGSCVLKKPKVSFWSNGNSHGYINISIDSDHSGAITLGEYFGTLAFGFEEEPFCGLYNTVSHELEPDTYTYRAWASDDSTEWNGSFTLTNCDCTSVMLAN